MVTQEELEKMSPEEIAELQRKNCIFCKIMGGEVPSHKVFDSPTTVAIMDINPGVKGHVLVMPKEHYPILPLVPPEVFSKLFTDAKIIAQAVKESTLSNLSTLFVANGPVAGQQAQHFLFHILPREPGDSLSNFNLPSKPELVAEQEQLAPVLKQNLPLMMQNHFKRIGGAPFKQEVETKQAQEQALKEMEVRREQIAKIIQDNPDVRKMIREDVEGFKKLVDSNDEMKNVFQGVDINALSKNLKSVPDEQFAAEQPEQPEQVEQTKEEPQPVQEDVAPVQPPKEEAISVSPIADSPSPLSTPIFTGPNATDQRKRIGEYFESNKAAEDLFIKDINTFKELMSKRPDIQELFKDVDVDRLSIALGGAKSD